MSQDDFSDEESRTVAIGTKRARTSVNLHQTSRKRVKYRPRVGYQDLRDFVPRGGTFGLSTPAERQDHLSSSCDVDQKLDTSDSSSGYQIPQTSLPHPAMNWNNNPAGSIRTSLRGGGDLGHNRLATGFRRASEKPQDGPRSPPGVIEISDDSDMEDDSEGGILLNVHASSRTESSVEVETPIELSEREDGEIADKRPRNGLSSKPGVIIGRQPPVPKFHSNTSQRSNTTSSLFMIDAHRGARILADLNPEDLENQIKYALFHLPRDQIDLSRPVVCLACLNEGHADQYCPGLLCSSCGGQTRHSSRLCPKQARCPKCGERGHNVDSCNSKLRNANLEPCGFCGGSDHVEVSCTERFFPARIEVPETELQLWISCAQCGSKDHLAGDCPTYGCKPAAAWSLRTYDHDKIVNLSLQTGAQIREIEAQNKGIRPEGMQIKGRGAPRNNKYGRRGDGPKPSDLQFEDDDDDDDFTSRLARNMSRRSSPPRSHLRFGNDDRGRPNRSDDDYSYRPPPNRRGPPTEYDSYHPSSSNEYRDRNGYREGRGYQEDHDYYERRPRSRSPPRHGDNWRPPLPRGPPPRGPPPRGPPSALPPARPALGRNQQPSQTQSRNQTKKGKRGGGKARNGSNRGRS